MDAPSPTVACGAESREICPLETVVASPDEVEAEQIPTPYCENLSENADAFRVRAQVNALLANGETVDADDPLMIHIRHGLAYTTGSALGSTPPTQEQCLAAFLVPNKAGLTAGARAWSKHAHRSSGTAADALSGDATIEASAAKRKAKEAASAGWWGTPSGPVAGINERALALFWRVMHGATWRNLHWLPHGVLVYEVRVPEGYGMRWSQDLGGLLDGEARPRVREECVEEAKGRVWMFRGFVEPMMENGHEVGWRH